jgi:predicted RNA-binding Zn ribbon-like protein
VTFELIADRPVLDFVATVAERGTTHEEKLRGPDDLARWIAEAGLLDAPPAVTPAGLDRGKTLREALFALLTALIDGMPAPPADRELVNAAAARPRPVLRLAADGLHREGDLDAALAALAHDALDLHDSPDRALLRWCADAACTHPFVDRSRGARRRWCGMRGCGDRAKAAAYRRRRAVTSG